METLLQPLLPTLEFSHTPVLPIPPVHSSLCFGHLFSIDIILGLSQEGTAPEITEKLTSTEVKEGDEARLTCRVRGKPEPEIEWYKDDDLMEESDTVIFEIQDDSYALIIKNVSLADEAEYKALARNPLGTASCSAELLVEESVNKPELIEAMMDVQVSS